MKSKEKQTKEKETKPVTRLTNKKGFWKTLANQKMLVLMSVPFVLYIILFRYVPLTGWSMAFHNDYKPAKVRVVDKNTGEVIINKKTGKPKLKSSPFVLAKTQKTQKVKEIVKTQIEIPLELNGEPILDAEGNQIFTTIITQEEETIRKPVFNDAGEPVYEPWFTGMFKWFRKLFSEKEFLLALRNTVCMSLISTALGYITAIILAVFMNEVKNLAVKRAVQTLSYLPHFLSWIIVTSLVANVLAPDGIINDILVKLGFIDIRINFRAIPKYFWHIVGWTYVWKEVGWNTIVYLGAMTSVDPCLYEAAEIDGCGRLRKIWHITLPGIKPTIIIMMIMSAGHILDANFEMPYLLKNSMIEDVAQTIDIYVLKYGFQLANYSLATASGIFKNLVNILLLIIANTIAKKSGEERLI